MRRGTGPLLVLVGYVLLAVLVTWPLARHLDTALTGDVNGDTGVYVWNLWIFQHELVEHHRAPFSTDHVFASTGGDDFALHNYTPVAGAVATALVGSLGLVATFNVIYLALIVGSAIGVYLLARQWGLGRRLAWLAGALFAASPVLIAKGTAHFSLVAAAPLPLFLWALERALAARRIRDGLLVGAITAWATYSDAYYGIYCVLMGLVLLALRFLRWAPLSTPAVSRAGLHALDTLIVILAAVVGWRLATGAEVIHAGPFRASIHTLYTPVLILTLLVAARLWLPRRVLPRWRSERPPVGPLLAAGAAAVATCLILLSPLLVGLALRAADGQLPATEIFWRSSPRGVDLLAYAAPNPGHPLATPATARLWLPDRPDAFPEYVASFPLTALALIALAGWRGALPRFWVAFTLAFVALSLGPFVHVAGVNTYVPGPWALLRYVPAIEMARTPSRFAIVAALGLAMLTAFAVRALAHSASGRRWMAAALALLACEILPLPRHLYPADVPDVYRIIAASNDETSNVLTLPTGIRDGTSSIGDFAPAEQFYQTRHGRPLVGGYLSRVSAARRNGSLKMPVLGALLRLSGGAPIDEATRERALAGRDTFLRRSCVGFVVLDRARSSEELTAFAEEVLRLDAVHTDERYVLYVPRDRPPCDPPPVRGGARH